MPETCATCRFWRKIEPHHSYADCRRLPPAFDFSVLVRRDGYGADRDQITVSRFPHARWPNTAETDWCGEYRAQGETVAHG